MPTQLPHQLSNDHREEEEAEEEEEGEAANVLKLLSMTCRWIYSAKIAGAFLTLSKSLSL